ncbi:MAG: DNA replication/repair protein RecF [Flavobacteriaceae bacterium]|nr:DNA replication/repair protein RecF [Muriicola sp.]MBT8289205.1 DNA replication/repair protein RecF [Muriicola sp.]NNK21625.1 DNA replication/repair protein RecF [Flavobacteriaceae bacterium]NNK34398.1 DNA replication/repair protein RecF [Eudoraea sp.]NNL40346.1 DNA replication/repair protein RecF [Flavobacteriaceae bacterium]
MFLQKISLLNYKNFSDIQFEFDSKINCFVGNNGRGKTNMLDAIYHLSFGKSYFNPIATQNIKHGEDFFVIEGTFSLKGREEKIVCSLKRNVKKVIRRNGKAYDRLSEHIGLLPLVIISPADRDLIIEGSETRRKFMDGVISQSDPEYLHALLNYQKAVSQRNALLKYFAANHTYDPKTIEVYNEQLHSYGQQIYDKRVAFTEEIHPIFKEQYRLISGDTEEVNLIYNSRLHEASLADLLSANIDRDRALQYTSVGVHKDDLDFEIGTFPIKKFGSQGQQKSFLIALKFAQFKLLKKLVGTTPILLLDDIFDKLDESRVAHIISLVEDDNFGQIFISDTHAERTERIIKEIHQTYKIFPL